MSPVGVNKAVTQDGEAYNKLRRPDNFLASLTAPPPPKSERSPMKRKLQEVDNTGVHTEQEPAVKRSREEKARSNTGKAFPSDSCRVFRPVRENGMQTMFPGLDGDESSDEATQEALAYLRNVRSEASNIPTVLIAAPEALDDDDDEHDRSMYKNGVGDSRAVYRDGTWVAVDHDAAEGYYDDDWSESSDHLDPQEAYYKSLLTRYQALRNTLAGADLEKLASLVKANPESHACAKPPSRKYDWRHAFDNQFPTPALVAQISDKNLYYALEHVAGVVARDDIISKQKSCWIWTLLAMAGDPGTLDYYKVGKIRDLGHKAGQLSIRLHSGERRMPSEDDREEDVEEWEADGEGIDGEDDQDDELDNEEGAGLQDSVSATADQAQGEAEEARDISDDASVALPTQLGAQLDGSDNRPSDIPVQPVEQNENNSNDKDTSMSEEEGEVQDEANNEDEQVDLEAARARLLAQLGDRLVTTSIPDPVIPPHQLKASHQDNEAPRRVGGRHRHNGKVCHDPSCRFEKRRQDAHRKAGLRAAQDTGTTKPKSVASATASRGAPRADELRQLIRAEKIGATRGEDGLANRNSPETSKPPPPTSVSGKEAIVEKRERMPRKPDTGSKDINTQQDGPGPSESHAGHTGAVDLNTRATIDMILTVVGECYGQKDLLRFRELW